MVPDAALLRQLDLLICSTSFLLLCNGFHQGHEAVSTKAFVQFVTHACLKTSKYRVDPISCLLSQDQGH